MEIGITTFAELLSADDGQPAPTPGQRLREVVTEAVVAEQSGLDVFGIGEHYKPEFADSAPAIVLAAAAGQTSSIALTSAVTVLSTNDPVRVYQQFATLDLLSSGRAEIIAGRGSATESFPLFGYDLADRDELFTEKLELLLALRSGEPVTWSGKHRTALHNETMSPRTERKLPVWIGAGGSPESVIRAGLLGLPLVLAIVGGDPAQFAPLADLYRKALAEGGHDPQPIAVNAHGYVAESEERAVADFYPGYAASMTKLMRQRGGSGSMTPRQFEASRSSGGALLVGNPEQVADKISAWQAMLGLDRFLLHVNIAALPHDKVLNSIELLGKKVTPLVR
ncbi:LLM class flavin-dependent oxidoreductase [Nocardia salmonicida]